MKLIYAPDTREEDLEQAFKKNGPRTSSRRPRSPAPTGTT